MPVLPPCPETLHLRGLHLYHYALSHNSRKVRLCLEEKNLPWREHHVDLFAGENFDEPFLRVNPCGTVPVLIHDGQILSDSNDIVRHLDSEFPDPTLTPPANGDRVAMERLVQLERGVQRALSVLVFHFYFRGAHLADLKRLKAAQRAAANKELVDFYRAASRGFSRRYLQGRIAEVRRPLQHLEDLLSSSHDSPRRGDHRSSTSSLASPPSPSPSLLGLPFLTQADVIWSVVIQTLKDIGFPLLEYPRLLEWHAAVSRRESFRRCLHSPHKRWLEVALAAKTRLQRLLGWGVEGVEYSVSTMWLLPTLMTPLPLLWWFLGPKRLRIASPPISRRQMASSLFISVATTFSISLLKAHLPVAARIPPGDVTGMRAVTITRRGGPEVLRLEEALPAPRLRANDEALIRVAASSASPADLEIQSGFGLPLFNLWRWMRGLPVGEGREFPLVLGRDIAGTVEAVGATVTLFKPGDEVFAAAEHFEQGALAELVVVKEWQLARKPRNLTFDEAASLPHAATEAWAALVEKGGLDPLDCVAKRVLVHAASGGLGAVAVQLVKAWGGHVTATCGPSGVAFVRELGADEVVDVSGDHFEDVLMHKPKFDLVVNSLGPWACDSCLYLCKEGGHVVTLLPPIVGLTGRYGLLGGSLLAGYKFLRTRLEQRLLFDRHYRWMLRGKPYGAVLELVKDLVEEGRVNPVVDAVFPLDAADLAFERLRQGTTLGKNVIRVAAVAEESGGSVEGGREGEWRREE